VSRRIHRIELVVDESVLDENGHVNNVAYVAWMQEAAIAHAEITGGTAATRAAGCTWVARSHQIEYLRPAYAGERIEVRTWIGDLRRAGSQRRYRFVRLDDGVELARGATDWVFVDAGSGRPRRIPETVTAVFDVVGETEPAD
jgi:acyl-CoA thioester hydrolase